MDTILATPTPGVQPLLVGTVGADVGGDVDAVDRQTVHTVDEAAEGTLSHVGEPAAVTHAVVGTELETEVEDATGLEGSRVLGDDDRKLGCGDVE